MVKKYIVTTVESDSEWGASFDKEYFDTYEEAVKRRDHLNKLHREDNNQNWLLFAQDEIKIVEIS